MTAIDKNQTQYDVRSITFKAKFLRAIDLIYLFSLPWVLWILIIEYALWSQNSEHSVFRNQDFTPHYFYTLFVAFWAIRLLVRKRYTFFDVFICALPILPLLFIFVGLDSLVPESWTESKQEYLLYIFLGLISLCIAFICKTTGFTYSYRRSVFDLFSVLFPILNPFMLLALPLYFLLIIFAVVLVIQIIEQGQLGALWFLFIIPVCVKFIKKLSNPSAKLLMKIDPRKPILYLRSFSLDNLVFGEGKKSLFPKKNIEQSIAKVTCGLGPFVAIANYRNRMQSIGAAKTSYSDDDWKGAVKEYLDKSQFVVMLAGETDAIDWELSTILSNNRQHDLLVLFGVEVLQKLTLVFPNMTIDEQLIKSEISKKTNHEQIIGVYLTGNNDLTLVTGSRNSPYSYIAAVHAFLKNRNY